LGDGEAEHGGSGAPDPPLLASERVGTRSIHE